MVNLSDIGPVPPFLASRDDLLRVHGAAVHLWETTQESDLTEILNQWETALTWRSIENDMVDDSWYAHALLVTCLRGLRGESPPKMWPLTPDN